MQVLDEKIKKNIVERNLSQTTKLHVGKVLIYQDDFILIFNNLAVFEAKKNT